MVHPWLRERCRISTASSPSRAEERGGSGGPHAELLGWQDQIGYVPQTIHLTDDTLRREGPSTHISWSCSEAAGSLSVIM